MQGKLLNNFCGLVLNAQALLRIPRLDFEPSCKAETQIQFSSPASPLGPEQPCINDGNFCLCDMEKEGEGGQIQGTFPCDAVAQLCNFSEPRQLFHGLASLHRAGCPHCMGLNPLNHPQKTSTEEEEMA